jgi:hypothetical protein
MVNPTPPSDVADSPLSRAALQADDAETTPYLRNLQFTRVPSLRIGVIIL